MLKAFKNLENYENLKMTNFLGMDCWLSGTVRDIRIQCF